MAKGVKKILVPFDGSKNSVNALQQAIIIAKASNATLTGLYVLNTPLSKGASNVMKKWRNKARQDAVDILDRARGRAEYDKVQFNEKIMTGNPGTVINNFAKKNKFDMIVMGARGLTKLKTMFLGSVSNQVVNTSKIPVVIVR